MFNYGVPEQRLNTINGTISNCILDIPQNLKIEIDSSLGVVVKAGSVITLDGSTYSTYTTTTDKVQGNPGHGRRVLFIQEAGGYNISSWNIESVVSGATDSLAGQLYHLWFDTTNKEIKAYTTDGNTVAYRCSYPLCIVDVDADNNISFVKDSNGNDMIFNGAGFVGHHAFVYPNVKALIPDGLNADGSMKSINYTNNALRIVEMSSTTPASGYKKILQMGNTGVYNTNNYREVESYNDLGTQNYSIQYVKKDNVIYYYNSATYETRIILKILSYTYDGTTVTDFAIRQPVRTATVEMVNNTISTIFPVGSVYIGIQADCPLTSVIPNSIWQLQASGLVLQCSDSDHAAGSTIEAGLPEIEATWRSSQDYTPTGAAYQINNGQSGFGSSSYGSDTGFKASSFNSIYGNSDTVQPPALVVNVWIRTK